VSTVRLTVAQALVRFLARQHSERDGVRQRLIAGCFGEQISPHTLDFVSQRVRICR